MGSDFTERRGWLPIIQWSNAIAVKLGHYYRTARGKLIHYLYTVIHSTYPRIMLVCLASIQLIFVGSTGKGQLMQAHMSDQLRGDHSKASSSTVQASVVIKELRPLTTTEGTPLSFGQLKPGQTDGTVVITTSNTRYSTGGVTVSGQNFSRAEFLVSGEPDAVYTIDIGPLTAFHDMRPDIVIGVTALEVSDLLSYSATVGSEGTVGRLNQNGVDSVFVGGTLVVPATALAGSYQGRVILTVNY